MMMKELLVGKKVLSMHNDVNEEARVHNNDVSFDIVQAN